jgi:hypothetical protein
MDSIEDLSSMAVVTSTDLLPFTALTTADTLTPPMLIRIITTERITATQPILKLLPPIIATTGMMMIGSF